MPKASQVPGYGYQHPKKFAKCRFLQSEKARIMLYYTFTLHKNITIAHVIYNKANNNTISIHVFPRWIADYAFFHMEIMRHLFIIHMKMHANYIDSSCTRHSFQKISIKFSYLLQEIYYFIGHIMK